MSSSVLCGLTRGQIMDAKLLDTTTQRCTFTSTTGVVCGSLLAAHPVNSSSSSSSSSADGLINQFHQMAQMVQQLQQQNLQMQQMLPPHPSGTIIHKNKPTNKQKNTQLYTIQTISPPCPILENEIKSFTSVCFLLFVSLV